MFGVPPGPSEYKEKTKDEKTSHSIHTNGIHTSHTNIFCLNNFATDTANTPVASAITKTVSTQYVARIAYWSANGASGNHLIGYASKIQKSTNANLRTPDSTPPKKRYLLDARREQLYKNVTTPGTAHHAKKGEMNEAPSSTPDTAKSANRYQSI